MFSRKNKAERTAAQAWDYLSSAMTTAGDSAKEAGRHTVDVTSTGRPAGRPGEPARARSSPTEAGKTSSKLADKAGKRGAKLAGKANKKLNKAADEAWARANAGRQRPGRQASPGCPGA